MPERVATGRIIVGKDEETKVIEPNQRFRTEEYGMSEEDVKRYDETGITREVRDEPKAGDRGPREETPREESELGHVVENRSERATEVTSERETNRKDNPSPEPQQQPRPAATTDRAQPQHGRQPPQTRRNEDL